MAPLMDQNGSGLDLPNYSSPNTRVTLVLGVEIPLASIAILVVLLRLYCQAFIRDRLVAADYIMGLAMLMSFSMTITNCFSLLVGTGYHIVDFYSAWQGPTGEYATIAQALFAVAISLSKVSVLLFYLHHFPSKYVQLVSKLAIVFMIGWGISDLFGSIFDCSPVQTIWNPRNSPTAECESYINFLFATAALNTFSDFWILLLPLFSLAKIRLSGKQVTALLLIFGLGTAVIVLGLIRIFIINEYNHSNDRPFELAILYIIQASTSSLVIISGSLPSLQPLMHHIFPRIDLGEKAKHRRKLSVEYNSHGRRRYRPSLTGDLRRLISKPKPFVEDKPMKEEQRHLSTNFQLVGSKDIESTEAPPIERREGPRTNELNLEAGPPGAPPNYPLPPIPLVKIPTRTAPAADDPPLSVPTNSKPPESNIPRASPIPIRAKVTLFPAIEKAPLRGILKAPKNTATRKPPAPQQLKINDLETRLNVPQKSPSRPPNFGTRETMWPAY